MSNINNKFQIGEVHAQTLFKHTITGRISCENSPDRSPAPLLWIGGGTEKKVFRFRSDVPDSIASRIERILADEAPLNDFETSPHSLSSIQKLLEAHVPTVELKIAKTYIFPSSLCYKHDFSVITSDTSAGNDLLFRIEKDGVPQELFQLGFADKSHFWSPWCVVHDVSKIASIAFTARLCESGAEVGVVTVPDSRGRGFAAAVVSAWATLPGLSDHFLFYGTDSNNLPSQRVAEKLQLVPRGSNFSFHG